MECKNPSPYGCKGNPKIKKYLCLLGTMPDDAFADLVGCNPQYPGVLRRKLGIAPPIRGNWDKYKNLFGKEEDAEIARLANRSLTHVRAIRRALGISPFYHPRTCVCGRVFTPKCVTHPECPMNYCSATCREYYSQLLRKGFSLKEAKDLLLDYGERLRTGKPTGIKYYKQQCRRRKMKIEKEGQSVHRGESR